MMHYDLKACNFAQNDFDKAKTCKLLCTEWFDAKLIFFNDNSQRGEAKVACQRFDGAAKVWRCSWVRQETSSAQWQQLYHLLRFEEMPRAIKRMIWSSARNSILGIYGCPTLRKPPLINFGLIQFTATPGLKLLSCPDCNSSRTQR